MQLQDLENQVLATLQQPGANFGGAPNWSALTNPVFGQGIVDFAINRAYERLLMDTADLGIALHTASFQSVANTYNYPLPPSGHPAIHLLSRVFYAPQGLSYVYEFEPGARLISWAEFQQYTGEGYLQPFAFGVQPDAAAVYPDRTALYFYPGSANTGDTITLLYVPIPTANTSVAPLANATDTPILPADTHEALVFSACAWLWFKAREFGAAAQFRQMYGEEVTRIREMCLRASAGDGLRIRDADSVVSSTYPFGPIIG